jgi:hypothetical protein
MTAVKKPKWPLNQLVSFELRDLRAELERALADIPERTADRQPLGQRLAEVISEQEARNVPDYLRERTANSGPP